MEDKSKEGRSRTSRTAAVAWTEMENSVSVSSSHGKEQSAHSACRKLGMLLDSQDVAWWYALASRAAPYRQAAGRKFLPAHKLVDYCRKGSVSTVAGFGLPSKQSRPSWRSMCSHSLSRLQDTAHLFADYISLLRKLQGRRPA
jgi:hypothetical protein